MPLPDGLATCILTGTYLAPDGTALAGQVTFIPSSVLTDPGGVAVLSRIPVTARLQAGTGSFSVVLPTTDNAELGPEGWQWQAIIQVAGATSSFWFLLPSGLGPTADISALTPAGEPPPACATFVSSVNGQTGAVTLADPGAYYTQSFTNTASVTVTHNLGRFPAVTVIDTANDVCIGDIQYLSPDTVQLTFAASFSGTAICN
jgi:hypothetical protein